MTLDEQVSRLVDLDYHALVGLSAPEFRKQVEPLSSFVPADSSGLDVGTGRAGCVLVVSCPAAPASRTLPRIVRGGISAVERLYPRDPGFFRPIPGLGIPAGDAYLLLDIDRGDDTLGMVPTQAHAHLAARSRLPLTIEEGIALLTFYPDFLQPNRCFMMLGSRGGDKRVPALWLSGKQPKLGWCWEGNPHTWLGFISCTARTPGVRLTPQA